MSISFLVNKSKPNGNRFQLARNIAKYMQDVKIEEIKDYDIYDKDFHRPETFVNFEEPQLTKVRDVHYFSFEGTRAPKHFIEALNGYNLLIVPSLHTKAMWLNSGVTKPVEVVPHGYDPELFSPDREAKSENSPFVFGFNGGWIQNQSDRKGLIYLLQAWKRLNLKDARLRIHLNQNALWPNYKFEDGLRNYGIRKISNVTVDQRDLAYENLAEEVYHKIDVLVSPSRAEGFNLPVLEAMACGKLCIATGWGGHTDFCGWPNKWINYELEDAPTFWFPEMYQGSKWATPDINSLMKHMQYCYDNQEETKKLGMKNPKLVGDYSYDKIAGRLIETVENYV